MTALELTALALVSRLLSKDDPLPTPRLICDAEQAARLEGASVGVHQDALKPTELQPNDVDASTLVEPPSVPQGPSTPQDDTLERFFTSDAGSDPRYYRAWDELGEVLAAFYADGRVRLADDAYRLVGIVQSGRADLLNIADNSWSELFVRATPEGRLQLQLRGAPFDMRVLTCEPLTEFRMTTT